MTLIVFLIAVFVIGGIVEVFRSPATTRRPSNNRYENDSYDEEDSYDSDGFGPIGSGLSQEERDWDYYDNYGRDRD